MKNNPPDIYLICFTLEIIKYFPTLLIAKLEEKRPELQ